MEACDKAPHGLSCCESTLVIDPFLVMDDATIASLAAAWLGKMEWNEPFPKNYHGGA